MAAMTAAAMPYALHDHEVILDFSIPPWFLDTVLKMVRARQIPLDYVVLLPSETICAERAANRAEGKIPDYGPYRELYSDFCVAEGHLVREDFAAPAALAAQIRAGLDEGEFRVQQ